MLIFPKIYLMHHKFLLPHRFKRVGTFIGPLGLIMWIAGQKGAFYPLLSELNASSFGLPLILSLSFFAFLFGLYFIVFSKEKKEDEYISQIRLASFQLAALLQLLFFVLSFIYMFMFTKEPESDSSMMLFLFLSIFIFWLFYIIRFNYLLHWKKKSFNKMYEE